MINLHVTIEAVQKVNTTSANKVTVNEQNEKKRNNTRLALAQLMKAELSNTKSKLSHDGYKNQSTLDDNILLVQRHRSEVQHKGQALTDEIKNKLLLISQKINS